jgi:hypothetical protein
MPDDPVLVASDVASDESRSATVRSLVPRLETPRVRPPLEVSPPLAAAADANVGAAASRLDWRGDGVRAFATLDDETELIVRILRPGDPTLVEIAGMQIPVADGCARFPLEPLRAVWEIASLTLTVTTADGRTLTAAFDG